MRLSDLLDGESAIITKIHDNGPYIKRLTEMGFIKGRKVVVVKNAPLKDPIEYELMGYSVSLRRKEAGFIEIEKEGSGLEDDRVLNNEGFQSQSSGDFGLQPERGKRVINVALIGNPNCGKTTLFNYISGLDEHVGNYSGVTVDSVCSSVSFRDYTIKITDLPGTYSVSSYSPEEEIVREELATGMYDFVLNVIDSTLLERNLYLTTQLMDMGEHVIVALNMYDELVALGDNFNHKMLSSMLDIPFIPTVGKKGRGVAQILDIIVKKYENELPHTHIESNFGPIIEDKVTKIIDTISEEALLGNTTKRYVSLMLLEGDASYSKSASKETLKLCEECRTELEKEYGEEISQILADSRYGYIAGALKETLTINRTRFKHSRAIDTILTHRIWGLPIFLVLIFVMFYATFTIGAYPQDWIDGLIGTLGEFVSNVMPDGALKDLIVDGVIGGVGSVIVFLPNILILFLFISILEDTGYMARVAFIMDKLMHKIGLHGKSFIPLVMGFGCNVPAIMATRIIEDKNNRLLTMLIIPFMSCSARLPVYILIIGAFFPSHASLVLFGVYLTGMLLAILSSLIFKKSLMKGADHPFVMELPPYRIPSAKSTIKHMWNKGSQYLRKMGGVIMIGVVLIWALSYYPNQQDSYLKKIGHTIEPAIEPLGFDWKIGVSLVSGIAAKEIVVGTMGVLNQVEASDEDNSELAELLRNDEHKSGERKGEKVFSLATALSFLAFILIYFPCVAVISAIRRESGAWKWALLSMFYTTGLAWIVSFAVYNIFR